MTRLIQRVLGPVFRAWSPIFLFRAGIVASTLPKPTDAPVVRIPGPDPDQILVVGGGIAVGFGVLSHELGIAGHLARQITGATGRGIRVDIIAEPDFRVEDARGRLRDVNVTTYDAVVVFLGVTDSIRHTSPRAWHRGLSALLDDLNSRSAAGARALIVGIQPVRLITTLDKRAMFFAELHARVLERETVRVCASRSYATYLPFHPSSEPSERYRTSAIYGRWASLVSPSVVDALETNHPFGDFAI